MQTSPEEKKTTVPKPKEAKLSAWLLPLSVRFVNAVKQVMFYCAIHFFTQEKWNEVIVLPAVGPYWCWGGVSRGEIPAYDWTAGEVMGTPEDEKKAASFAKRFSWEFQPHHILGMEESDQQLMVVRSEVSSLLSSH